MIGYNAALTYGLSSRVSLFFAVLVAAASVFGAALAH